MGISVRQSSSLSMRLWKSSSRETSQRRSDALLWMDSQIPCLKIWISQNPRINHHYTSSLCNEQSRRLLRHEETIPSHHYNSGPRQWHLCPILHIPQQPTCLLLRNRHPSNVILLISPVTESMGCLHHQERMGEVTQFPWTRPETRSSMWEMQCIQMSSSGVAPSHASHVGSLSSLGSLRGRFSRLGSLNFGRRGNHS
jgi:hypothetical protein